MIGIPNVVHLFAGDEVADVAAADLEVVDDKIPLEVLNNVDLSREMAGVHEEHEDSTHKDNSRVCCRLVVYTSIF